MPVGKRMQFFGARVNLAKTLLYAINGGRDEISGKQVIDLGEPVAADTLDFDDVWERFDAAMTWLADTYVNALNIIHYMHDKYAYERLEMALHDYDPERTLACGIAGLSIVADSLSAIKYAGVHPVRDETGLITEFDLDGEYPAFGNNDARVDDIAAQIVTHVHGQDPLLPGLPRRAAHPVGADHHVERRLRRQHRLDPGRSQARRALRPRRQPDARS